MTIYKNCLMTAFDAEDTFETECEVNITDEEITLSYFHEEIQAPINYFGKIFGTPC